MVQYLLFTHLFVLYAGVYNSNGRFCLCNCLVVQHEGSILKQGRFVIASIQSALTDDDLLQLRDDLAAYVVSTGPKGSLSTLQYWM